MQRKNKTNESLKLAVKFEKEGRDFFLKAAKTTHHPLGRQMFVSLANDELHHLQRVKQIFDTLQQQGDWPTAQSDKIQPLSKMQTIFEQAKEHLTEIVKPKLNDIEALQLALEYEKRGYKFYQRLAKEARLPAEKKFYQELAAQDDNHYQIIQTTQKYLEKPWDWYADQEYQIYEG